MFSSPPSVSLNATGRAAAGRRRGLRAAALRIPLVAGVLAVSCNWSSCASQRTDGGTSAELHWFRGNMHTHSLWSDGADYPEMIASWYRDAGYNFLVVTEHNRLQEGEMWVDLDAEDAGWPPRNQSAREALQGFRERFPDHADIEVRDGRRMIRLRGLSQYRHLFEVPQRFLLIMGEEITDAGGAHVNAINLPEPLLPRGGASTAERTRNNLDAVAALRARTGIPILAIVNHPNFLWSLTAAEIAAMKRARFFEVRSGHTLVNDDGDTTRPGTERIWDLVLAHRHAHGMPPIYGVGTDDAHDYRSFGGTVSLPGRAWVVVRAAELTPARLIDAMERGDFYISTGVTLRDVRVDDAGMHIEIEPEPGASYRTRFIGTRTGIDIGSDTTGVGEVLAEFDELHASYVFRGDERYVRAVVTSSLMLFDAVGGRPQGWKRAWVQPAMRS
ncbi:hypothetical protein BH23GEM9_BH23GEM9_13930 [soil metagenome]